MSNDRPRRRSRDGDPGERPRLVVAQCKAVIEASMALIGRASGTIREARLVIQRTRVARGENGLPAAKRRIARYCGPVVSHSEPGTQ